MFSVVSRMVTTENVEKNNVLDAVHNIPPYQRESCIFIQSAISIVNLYDTLEKELSKLQVSLKTLLPVQLFNCYFPLTAHRFRMHFNNIDSFCFIAKVNSM